MRVLSVDFYSAVVSVFVFFEDFDGHIVNCRVVEHNNAAVRTRFDVNALIFAEIVVAAAEIVAYSLYGDVEFVGDAVHRTIWQTVFKAAQLVEGDCLTHDYRY